MNRILTLLVLVLVLTFAGTSQAAVVNVAASGSSNAAGADNTYVFATGEYLYTIAGFNVGDVLSFPAGAGVSVVNTCTPIGACDPSLDGSVEIYGELPAEEKMISVKLTGLTKTQDTAIFGPNSFKTVFGAGSIIIGSGTKPGDCDGVGGVSIAEVQSAINMFLGIKPATSCVDTTSPAGVSIAEVQKVINGFLGL